MGYYLDRAQSNKQQFEALNFTPQQLNLVASMMLQCRKLRQRDPIINLLRHSLPNNFEMELVQKESEDGTRTWLSPLILEKKAVAQ
ncbi:MAG: hypothetical protein K5785_00885 [Nitrosarchaeum sp.]|nr:hypothetical protein [Nitrosarchaeum sp.]